MIFHIGKRSILAIFSFLCLILACSKEPRNYKLIAGIPEYYFENGYLDGKLNELKNAMSVSNGVTFGFLSDIHISKYLYSEDPHSTSGNAGYSPFLLKYFIDSLHIPFVLFGGDVPVVRTRRWDDIIGSADKWQQMMNIIGKEKVFQTRGNHEYLGFVATDAKEVTKCTPEFLYPILMEYDHIYDVESPKGKMYYYFDVDKTNLRVIVLDDYGDQDTLESINGNSCIGQSQYDWLINTALSCDNKNIILLSHQTSDPILDAGESDVDTNRIVLHEVLKSFVNKSLLDFTSSDCYGDVTVKADFSNNTNTFVCHLSGHRHQDEYSVTDGVLSIVHTCDCYSGYRPQGNYFGRVPGTITEHAVSFFSIDFDSRIISMIRIGAGESFHWKY